MPNFLYYLPRGMNPRDEYPHAFLQADRIAQTALLGAGPGGESGIIYSREGDGVPGYHADRQTWHEAAKDHWIGMNNDAPPGSEDLKRPEMIGGHPVKLGDGNEWLIPVARCFPQGTMLPQVLILGPNNEWVVESLPEFARVSRHADRIWQDIRIRCGLDEAPKDYPGINGAEAAEIAIEYLALNYRMSRVEVSLLRLFRVSAILEILQAIVDWPTREAVMADLNDETKKKGSADTQDGFSTDDGEPES